MSGIEDGTPHNLLGQEDKRVAFGHWTVSRRGRSFQFRLLEPEITSECEEIQQGELYLATCPTLDLNVPNVLLNVLP